MPNSQANHAIKKDSSIKVTAAYYTLILPVTEILFFMGAAHFLLESKEWQVILLFLFAAFFLSLSVHICFHEFLHLYFKQKTPWFVSYGFTLLAGMPFDGFRLHHINHHQHNNSPLDFSTTWGTTCPQNIFLYALKWPLQLFKVMRFARLQAKQGLLSQEIQSNIRRQQIFLIGLFCIVVIISPKIFLLYAALVYIGWVIVSIHNYGQHSHSQNQLGNRIYPIKKAKANHYKSTQKKSNSTKINTATSIYNRWYNIFLFNNGLHFEHHDQPEKSWRELTPYTEIVPTTQKQNRMK